MCRELHLLLSLLGYADKFTSGKYLSVTVRDCCYSKKHLSSMDVEVNELTYKMQHAVSHACRKLNAES